MKFKNYLNELFNQPVELKIQEKWNVWSASFTVANDVYTINNRRTIAGAIEHTLTDKELKKLTGTNMQDVERESARIKKDREEGHVRIPINLARHNLEKFFGEHHVWVISFSSKKFGDKNLDIRTRSEVAIIYSGVKKAVGDFVKKIKPSFIIIDAKDPKKLSIYKRFVDELSKRGGYKNLGNKKRKIDYGDEYEKTTGYLLFSGKMTP